MKLSDVMLWTILLLLIAVPSRGYAMEEILQEQLQGLDSDEISLFIDRINQDYKDFLPEYNFRDFVELLKSGGGYDVKTLVSGAANFFLRELAFNSRLLAQLISLAVVCAILNNIQSAFNNDNISQITQGVTYLVLLTIVIQSFYAAINIGKETIDQMVSFIQAIIPIMMTILTALGNISSVAIFKPLIFMGITLTSTWIKNILLPFIFFTAVLSLVGNISDRFHISALTRLLRQTSIFLLGCFTSIFLGIVAVQGAGSAVVDGISIRTAKFATKNFIPFVGGFFSDAVDMVMSCSLILKNIIGLMGLILIFIITVFPIAKLLSLVLIYKLAGAIIQPLGEVHIVKSLDEVSNSLMLILVSVSSVAIMFFVTITMIIASGNISVMMR